MIHRACQSLAFIVGVTVLQTALLEGSETSLERDVAALLQAEKHGRNQTEAAEAWRRLVDKGPAALPFLFDATPRANPVAFNWIVMAADRIVDAQRAKGGRVPDEIFLHVIRDRSAPPKIRWWAWYRLNEQSPQLADSILENALDDPAPQLRRAAVQRAIEKLGDVTSLLQQSLDVERENEIRAKLKTIFRATRDRDQAEMLAQWLRKLGESVDLAAHFGYVRNWFIVGPFDNTNDQGFNTPFPPENGVNVAAIYSGKHGEVKWRKIAVDNEEGRVDLNEALSEEKGVIAYAWIIVEVDQEQDGEIRWATPNATKIWLNGQLLASYHVYHSGYEEDQYRVSCRFRQGKNELLLKICQNEQTQSWARFWEFRLRVCDTLGGGIARTGVRQNGDQ